MIKKTYHILNNEIDKIEVKSKDITPEKFYYCDEETGEFIPVLESRPKDANDLSSFLKRSTKKEMQFYMAWQETQKYAAQKLTGSSFKMLQFFAGTMKYNNIVYGYTYLELGKELSMSNRTITRAIKELTEEGFIIQKKEKGKNTYIINPSYAWKGSFFKMKSKMDLFEEVMRIKWQDF